MSRPRSRSPRYRRFPWEESSFNPDKVVADLDSDGSCHPRGGHEKHLDFLMEEIFTEGRRRSPPFPDKQALMHQRRSKQEEFYLSRASPHGDAASYDDRRLSPLRNGGGDGDRRRGGFQEHPKSFEAGASGRSAYSPLRLPRERLPPMPRSHPDHQQREPGMGWRREEQGRSQGRFRDLGTRSDDHRGGASWERGRRNTQDPQRERQREESHQERNPFKRQRREAADGSHLGYRNEELSGEQWHSVDTTRDRTGRDDPERPGPLVIEHDHGLSHGRETSRWTKFDGRRDQDPDIDRGRSPCLAGSSQERFRTSNFRSDRREDARRRPQEDWRGADHTETRRSPAAQDRGNNSRYGSHRGRSGPHPARGRYSHGQAGKNGPHRNQPSSQGYQDVSNEETRTGLRPFREDLSENPTEGEADWAEGTRDHEWKPDRPGRLDRHVPKIDLDPKMPRQRMQKWIDQRTSNMAAVIEETLTIKVDMSRPTVKNSSLSYSSDRQLSLDLVNVGRQRLDFLPMLEHSGTYRETTTHTGTFAQEIITLVHQVKEQYFKDGDVTLNERFSALQTVDTSGAEPEELTLDARFSSHRGFNPNMNSAADDDEPPFCRPGALQPVRGPGDLRHDLERRRQERLEGVKVTISGSSVSQRLLGPASEPDFSDELQLDPMDDEGFSTWPQEQNRRREGHTGSRGGASFRPNNRFYSRLGPMRRQNNPAGPAW